MADLLRLDRHLTLQYITFSHWLRFDHLARS